MSSTRPPEHSTTYSRLLVATIPIGIMTILIAVVTLLEPPARTRLWEEFFNAGHAPLFGFVAVTMLYLLSILVARPSRTYRWRYLAAGITAVVLGVITEFVQSSMGRDAEYGDLVRDILGTVSFLLIAAAFDRASRIRSARTVVRWTCICSAVLLLAVTQVSLGQWSVAYLHRDRAFPTLASFDSDTASRFFSTEDASIERCTPPIGWKSRSNVSVGKITFRPVEYPTIILDEPYPDWRGYTSLVISLFHPSSDSLKLDIRVEDRQHNGDFTDRFNAAFELVSGSCRIEIPLDKIARAPLKRPMDMSAIHALALFMVNPPEEKSIFIDSVFLR